MSKIIEKLASAADTSLLWYMVFSYQHHKRTESVKSVSEFVMKEGISWSTALWLAEIGKVLLGNVRSLSSSTQLVTYYISYSCFSGRTSDGSRILLGSDDRHWCVKLAPTLGTASCQYMSVSKVAILKFERTLYEGLINFWNIEVIFS